MTEIGLNRKRYRHILYKPLYSSILYKNRFTIYVDSLSSVTPCHTPNESNIFKKELLYPVGGGGGSSTI